MSVGKHKNVRLTLRLLGLLALASFVAYFVSNTGGGRQIKVPLESMKNEVDTVVLPRGSHIIGDVVSSKKGSSNLVEASMTTSLSSAEIVAHYNEELSRNGWMFKSEEISTGKIVRVFCKGLLDGILLIRLTDSFIDRYYLSISYSGDPVKLTGC